MALETLTEITNVDYVTVNNEENTITFRLQDGPIAESGVNGCQVDILIKIARQIISGFNEKFPCRENSIVLTKLDEALLWLKNRTREREARGVEGHNIK